MCPVECGFQSKRELPHNNNIGHHREIVRYQELYDIQAKED